MGKNENKNLKTKSLLSKAEKELDKSEKHLSQYLKIYKQSLKESKNYSSLYQAMRELEFNLNQISE